jgi:hypothetical protein
VPESADNALCEPARQSPFPGDARKVEAVPSRDSIPAALRADRKAKGQEACACLVAYANHKRVSLV